MTVLMSTGARSLPVIVDCLERHAVCGAQCCTFDVPLTEDELASGRYLVADPPPGAGPEQQAFLRRRDDGLCTYHSAQPEACTIYAARPQACRAFSCHADVRIWRDFAGRRLNQKAITALRGRGTTPPRSTRARGPA
jgi:hypothetical protein